MTVQIGRSTGQYTHARARQELPPSAKATWLSPARRRGRGMFSLGGPAEAERINSINHWLSWLKNGGIDANHFILEIVEDVPAPYSSVEASILRQSLQYGVTTETLEALLTSPPPAPRAFPPIDPADPNLTPRAQTDMLRWGLLGGGVLAVAGISWLILRRKRS